MAALATPCLGPSTGKAQVQNFGTSDPRAGDTSGRSVLQNTRKCSKYEQEDFGGGSCLHTSYTNTAHYCGPRIMGNEPVIT